MPLRLLRVTSMIGEKFQHFFLPCFLGNANEGAVPMCAIDSTNKAMRVQLRTHLSLPSPLPPSPSPPPPPILCAKFCLGKTIKLYACRNDPGSFANDQESSAREKFTKRYRQLFGHFI